MLTLACPSVSSYVTLRVLVLDPSLALEVPIIESTAEFQARPKLPRGGAVIVPAETLGKVVQQQPGAMLDVMDNRI